MVGQFVLSIAGRDKGRLHVVCKVIDDKYILVTDGKTRKIDKPKRKKVMHVKLLGSCDTELAEKIVAGVATDKQVINSLKKCSENAEDLYDNR